MGWARSVTMVTGRRNRRGWLLTLIVLFAIVLCVSVFRWHRDASSIESPTNKRLSSFRDYCHDSLLESIVGEEGQLPHTPHSNRFKLVQVHGLFRHGDRSPSIHTAYRGADIMYQCGMVDNDPKWLKLQDFLIKPNPKSVVPPKHTNTKLFRGFSSLRCTNFQLTMKGFQQLHALGKYIRDKYLNIFTSSGDSVFTASDILVQSTDYTRTIQSAASFSLGFTPDSISRADVPIHVTPGTNLHAPPPHRETVYRRCKNYWKLYSEEVHRSEYMFKENQYKPFFDKIGYLLQINAEGNFDCEDIFDSVWGLVCHKLPLPCRDGVCLNESTIAQGAEYVNELFPEKHQFSNTILAIQPFLIHSIINEIDISIRYHHAADKFAEKKPFKFLFNFAHDSTLTFLLGSLGLRVDYWLPYASRVVFEVWQREQDDGDSKDHSPYFVRILLNGESLMQRVTQFFPAQVIEMDGELLLYNAWRETMVKGPYREKSDFDRRCSQGLL